MITKLLLLFLVSVEISNAVSWKRCSDTFCNKLRNSPTDIEQRYYIESIELKNETVRAILKTDKPKNAPKLILSIDIYEEEVVHMYIVEGGSTPAKRFRPTIALKNSLKRSSIKVDDNNDAVYYATVGSIRLEITKNPLNIKMYFKGRLFSEINPKNNFVFQTSTDKSIAMGITLHGVERAYGLPVHAEHLALRSTKRDGDPYRHFNVDYGNYKLESRESLYGSIGVLYGHGTNHSCGVFWLNAAQTWIDIETAPNNTEAFFMSESGIVDMFVLTGPTLPKAVQQYAKLTGTAPLPQYFALGYHQSRYSYMTQDEVLDIMNNLESHDMPVDVLWLDIDYTDQKMYFTWDPQRFSKPQLLIDSLEAKKRKLVAIIDPHIKVQKGYMVHDEATKQQYYVNHSSIAFVGDCWPGKSSYLDFLNPMALEYYSSLYSKYYFNNSNVHSWNDMNEPAVFNAESDENSLPLSAVHYGGWMHKDVHNIYGFYQTVGTKRGMMKSKPNLRPFILTRSHFAGIQRYAAIWTGDNAATWEYLQMSFPMCLTEALAGVSFCGADVGGFFKIPEDELYQRWYQAGAWLPFYRGHSTIDVPRREPYLFNNYVQRRVRTALFQRYAHLPMWYTIFFEHQNTGEPVIRPITYHYPEDGDALSIENQILLGTNILAAPVLEKGVLESKVYFPGGEHQIWFNIDDDYKPYRGIGYQLISVTLDSVPVFYRAGSIITRKDIKRLTSVDTHQDPFTLYICLDKNGNAEGRVYVDDYQSFNYTQNQFLYVNFGFNNNILDVTHVTNTTYVGAANVSEIIFINSRLYPISAVHIVEGQRKNLSVTISEENYTYNIKNFTVSLDKPFKIEFTFDELVSAVARLSILPAIVLMIPIFIINLIL